MPGSPAGAQTVGPYTLLTLLGEGGMGVVHLARDSRTGERVALKILRPQVVGDDEGRQRLSREVSSLERVRSRWIAEIRDADPWGAVPYVATRYVPGLSLHDYVQEEGPITGPDLWWMARCLAEGITACHAVGVLHRDVKPSNVLMEGRTPVLIDFGLARVADDPKITHTGWLLGTPGYLPPEILHGEDATAASDVHSWAATVAFAATGRPPFGRGPSMAIMDRARRGQYDLDGVPEPLHSVLVDALDPDPDRRPRLDELVAWLAAVQAGQAVAAPGGAAAATQLQAPPTMVLGEPAWPAPGTEDDELSIGHWEAPPEPGPAPVTTALKARRFALWVAGGLGLGASIAAVPWFAVVGILALVWFLRSSSMAAALVDSRRAVRGAKWYDVPRMVLGVPWDLLRSAPSTLLLALWSGGIALAAALVCYAVAAPAAGTMFVVGTVFVSMLWCGPGGDRVRGPLTSVVHPLARRPKAWLIALLIVVAAGAAAGAVAASGGPHWVPFEGPPALSNPF